MSAVAAARLPCSTNPELFFPTSGSSAAGKTQIKAASALCGHCPIRVDCLESWRALPPNERDVGAVAGGIFFRVGTGEATRRHHADKSEQGQVAA